jgi:hypothetical protein
VNLRSAGLALVLPKRLRTGTLNVIKVNSREQGRVNRQFPQSRLTVETCNVERLPTSNPTSLAWILDRCRLGRAVVSFRFDPATMNALSSTDTSGAMAKLIDHSLQVSLPVDSVYGIAAPEQLGALVFGLGLAW